MTNARKTGSLIAPLANIEVIESHQAGVVGGVFDVFKDQKFVAIYGYETVCMSFTVVYLDGVWVCFEAKKVKIFLA